MGLRTTPLLEEEYYHIYNRGTDKREIFIDDKDREHFVKLLYLCNSSKPLNFRDDIIDKKMDPWKLNRGEQIVSIGAWVIMPNHFHLYITFPKGLSFGKNTISTFMSKLCTSYTMYFNKRHSRTGSLFEGKFKSVHISDDIQAKYLFSYIHLNPIKLIQKDWKENGIRDKKATLEYLSHYQYSSYLDNMGVKRIQNKILHVEAFPKYFSTRNSFEKEILEWLHYNK